jgi:hypothetical protein
MLYQLSYLARPYNLRPCLSRTQSGEELSYLAQPCYPNKKPPGYGGGVRHPFQCGTGQIAGAGFEPATFGL